jgi:TM2 domain-containing membrane protein YozV
MFLIIDITPSEEQLSFANYLFEEEDYFRAITEYKRFIFLSQNQEKILFAKKRVFSSYKKAYRYDDAMDYLNTLEDNGFIKMEKGKLHLLSGNTENARILFKSYNSDTAIILKGWSYIEEGNWKKSREGFSVSLTNSFLSSISDKLYQYSEKADSEISKKNVAFSALLSSIIPGSGRFYTERYGDAFFSFLTVAIPGVISYIYWKDDRKRASYIALGFAATFYIGDIYGSVISAKEFNEAEKHEYIEKINKDLHIRERFILE